MASFSMVNFLRYYITYNKYMRPVDKIKMNVEAGYVRKDWGW